MSTQWSSAARRVEDSNVSGKLYSVMQLFKTRRSVLETHETAQGRRSYKAAKAPGHLPYIPPSECRFRSWDVSGHMTPMVICPFMSPERSHMN